MLAFGLYLSWVSHGGGTRPFWYGSGYDLSQRDRSGYGANPSVWNLKELRSILLVHHWCWCQPRIVAPSEVGFERNSKKLILKNPILQGRIRILFYDGIFFIWILQNHTAPPNPDPPTLHTYCNINNSTHLVPWFRLLSRSECGLFQKILV